MSNSSSSTNSPTGTQRKSKHALAKLNLAALESACSAEGIDRDEGVEALLTLCIQDMQSQRGTEFAREYVQYELNSLSSSGMYDVQKR